MQCAYTTGDWAAPGRIRSRTSGWAEVPIDRYSISIRSSDCVDRCNRLISMCNFCIGRLYRQKCVMKSLNTNKHPDSHPPHLEVRRIPYRNSAESYRITLFRNTIRHFRKHLNASSGFASGYCIGSFSVQAPTSVPFTIMTALLRSEQVRQVSSHKSLTNKHEMLQMSRWGRTASKTGCTQIRRGRAVSRKGWTASSKDWTAGA